MAAGFRGARPGILGKTGAAVFVAPVPPYSIQSPLDNSASFSLSTVTLGSTTFGRAPIELNTVQKMKDASSRLTWSSSAYEEWPVVSAANGVIGIERPLRWKIMSGALFLVLRLYFESTEQVTWDPGVKSRIPGEKYLITFSSLEKGRDHRVHDYVFDVVATFNIRGIAP